MTTSATDWDRILDALGDNRRLVVMKGVMPGTLELHVEEWGRSGFRAAAQVSTESIAHAEIDVIGLAVSQLVERVMAAPGVA